MKKTSILLVDDSYDMLEVLRRQLTALQYNTFQASTVSDAMDILKNSRVDLLITDMRMPGLDGMQLVKYAKAHFSSIPILVITGFPSVSGAVEAIKSGAMDYLSKPFTANELKTAVEKVLQQRYGRKAITGKQQEQATQAQHFHGILGQSPQTEALIDLIQRVKDTKVTTLIQGESGTGKELVARAIHYSGQYQNGPFVTVNCGAIPENLLESELFGYVKGAFTGADTTRPGFFQSADGGTIFLDEVGNASPAVQTRLLRVIQEKEINMVGSSQAQRVDLRIIAATNSDLHASSKSGTFREDLYYRLNVIAIHTPPLRDRREDIPLLLHHFLDKFAKEFNRPRPTVAEEAMRRLRQHSWPGNIRELENIAQRALILSDGTIRVKNLPEYLWKTRALDKREEEGTLLSLHEMEQQHIRKVLDAVDGNKSEAARILGINRKTLRAKLQKAQSPAKE